MIIPAILEQEWSEIEKKIEVCQVFSDTIHIDFIDGKFAANTTHMDPMSFQKFTQSNFLEAHLMVLDPIKYLRPISAAGFRRFIGQIEKMPDQIEFVAEGEQLGEVGLALDGNTPLEDLEASFEDLDILLFMAIDVGFSGREFKPTYLEKIADVPKWFTNIEIDGGINDETILQAKKLGGNIFTSNSYLFNGNPLENYQKLRGLARLAPESTQGA